jgi:hypothetical protein
MGGGEAGVLHTLGIQELCSQGPAGIRLSGTHTIAEAQKLQVLFFIKLSTPLKQRLLNKPLNHQVAYDQVVVQHGWSPFYKRQKAVTFDLYASDRHFLE